jgi:hypothetical protein
MFSFPNIVFKHPVALKYHLFRIYFRLKCNLLTSRPSSTVHVSALYDLHEIMVVKVLYIYDYIKKLCRQQAEVIQNHENANVRDIGKSEA